MGLGRRGLPGSRLLWLVLSVGAATLVACLDGPNGPGGGGPGFVALQPVFSSQIESGHFALGVDTVGLEVRRSGTGELVIDTLFPFDPDSTSLHLVLPIGMLQPAESFEVRLTLQDGSLALFAGTGLIELHQGPPGTNGVDSIHVEYEGPGKDIAQLAIVPGDTVLTWGDSTRLNVEARDSNGAAVPRFFVSWSASDTTTGRMDAFGKLRAPHSRGVVAIAALTPNGVSAEARVTFIPHPTQILLGGTDSASAPVGQAVTLVARVVAADGLGVLGLPVHFAALTPGGVVTDTVVLSDSLGRAATQLIVGDTLRDYVYEASVDTLRPVRRTVLAVAGPPAAVGIEAGDAQVGTVGEELPGVLAVRVVDGHGNPVRGQRVNFVVTAGGGSVYGGSSNTSDSGLAYERWTLGTTAGQQRLEARAVDNVTGAPLLFAAFTATAVAGSPAQLAFVLQPTGVAAGVSLSTVQVAVRDTFGNVVSAAGDTVRLSLAGPAGGTLTGATAAVTRGGIASFPGRRVQQAATGYVLKAVAGALQATSQAFDVVPAAPASVTVSAPDTVLTALGAHAQLTAVLRDAFGNVVTGQAAAWSSADSAVAWVDATGRVTARSNGTARVTASAGGATGGLDLTVRQAVTQVTLTAPTDSLTALGDTLRLAAVARDANGSPVPGATIVWSSSDTAVARVNASGLVTARANGGVTVTASAGTSIAATFSLRVAQVVASAQVTPQQTTLSAIGDSIQLGLTTLDANGFPVSDVSVTWTSSDSRVATVSASGVVTAVEPGQVTITATVNGGTVQSVTLAVQVWVGPAVQQVIVTPAADTLAALGESATLVATARTGQGDIVSGLTFTWASSNSSVASVTPGGVVTAVGNGSATITASASGVSGSAAVTVAQVVSAVAVTPGTVSLTAVGATQPLAASATDANGHVIANAAVTWFSRDPAVATVSAGGLVTAQANGTTSITATSGAASGTATVTVAQAVSAVQVSPDTATLSVVGAVLQMHDTVTDANGYPGAGAVVTWTSSASGVASVDNEGLVTALANGTATITASSGGHSASASVTVSIPTVPITVVIQVGSGDPKTINVGSNGNTPVAILTTSTANGEPVTFDATTVDPASVRFEGLQPSSWSIADVDNDGDLDLQLHFDTAALQLTAGSTVTVMLTGSTKSGAAIEGQEQVLVITNRSAARGSQK